LTVDLTIRLDSHLDMVSRDDGRSWMLSESAVEAIRIAAADAQRGEPLPFVSAVAAATLAEAHHVRPQLSPGSIAATIDVNGTQIALAPIARRIDVAFSDVLAHRRSARRLAPVNLDDLATVLVTSARIQSWHESEDGYQITARPAPSAGARHPCELDVVVTAVAGVAPGLWHFDPARCALVYIHDDQALIEPALAAVEAAGGLTATPPATIFLNAYMRRTLARYPAGSTLVWRDAGVLLGLLHMTAAAAGLASCIIGTAGVLKSDRSTQTADVGALVLGGPGPAAT
jgi:SagB-type dehydrogenase family enzyme